MSLPVPAGALRLRDPDETHRTATPLELFFDLCFVVAIAVLAAELHHAVADDHALDGAVRYTALFVPIWWAWMSHTWYATAFDRDDATYRVLTLAQMGGVLVLAACVPAAFAGDVLPFTLAYTAMRLPLVAHWWRAARSDAAHRTFAMRYAVGAVAAQSIWLLALAVPAPGRYVVWLVALLVDLGTPPLAVRAAPDRVFHPGHIAERYGLFTIIVLGETVLAVTVGLRDSLDVGRIGADVVLVTGSALVVAFAFWWLYFDVLGSEGLTRNRRAAFAWGYGHLAVYAGIAAVGAGVQAQLELLSHGGDGTTAPVAVAAPVAVTLVVLAWLQHVANLRSGEARLLVASGLAVAAVGALGGTTGAVVTDVLVASWLVVAVLASRRPA